MPRTNQLAEGVRARRKALITVAGWGEIDSQTEMPENLEVLGVRTEDSSIEFNPDTETSTDILGINYIDVNKTEPQQDFDPFFIIGKASGKPSLADYLADAALKNNLDAFTNVFKIYIIQQYISEATTGTTPVTHYNAVEHSHCSIIPTSIGGDNFVNMPIEVHLSNEIRHGYVNALDDTMVFTAET